MGGKWKKVLLLFKQFQEIFCSKTHRFGKLGLFLGRKNDALMHREGLKD